VELQRLAVVFGTNLVLLHRLSEFTAHVQSDVVFGEVRDFYFAETHTNRAGHFLVSVVIGLEAHLAESVPAGQVERDMLLVVVVLLASWTIH
jgi:hypothetical protein